MGKSGRARRDVLSVIAAGGGGLLAGCSTSSDGAATTAGTDARGTVLASDLTVWGWDVAARSLDLTDDPYEGRHGGSVSITEMKRENLKTQIEGVFESGSGGPDCTMMESVDGPAWIDTGGLRDVSAWIERDDAREGFVDAKWQALSRDDGIYALPWDIGPVGTFYRRDVFADHGIDPDSIETWEEFVAAGDALPEDRYLLNIPADDYDGFWRMQFRQLGGQPFTDDGKVNINSEKSLRVARTIKRIRDAGVANTLNSWSKGWFDAFRTGEVASLMAGSWVEGTLRDNIGETAGKWGVMKPPALEAGGSRATNWGGSTLAIPAHVDDAVARRAWDYMRFTLQSTAMQLRMYREFGIFPAYEPAYTSEAFDRQNDFFDGQRVGRLFAEIAPEIEGYRFTVDTPVVTTAINTHLAKMVAGEKSPQEAVDDAAAMVADETGREVA
jgi:ABC-type glycerol-3-phosphate transport system substrate-binding protein